MDLHRCLGSCFAFSHSHNLGSVVLAVLLGLQAHAFLEALVVVDHSFRLRFRLGLGLALGLAPTLGCVALGRSLDLLGP